MLARARSPERESFDHYLRTGRRIAALELKFNPNHDPETGRFTTAEGAGGAPEGVEEAQLTPGAILRGAGKLAGVAFPPADVGAIIVDNLVGAPLAPGMLPGTEQRDLNAKVRDILKTRKADVRRKELDPGAPSWDEIDDLTLKDILTRYKRNPKSYRTIWKLLNDRRFLK